MTPGAFGSTARSPPVPHSSSRWRRSGESRSPLPGRVRERGAPSPDEDPQWPRPGERNPGAVAQSPTSPPGPGVEVLDLSKVGTLPIPDPRPKGTAPTGREDPDRDRGRVDVSVPELLVQMVGPPRAVRPQGGIADPRRSFPTMDLFEHPTRHPRTGMVESGRHTGDAADHFGPVRERVRDSLDERLPDDDASVDRENAAIFG